MEKEITISPSEFQRIFERKLPEYHEKIAEKVATQSRPQGLVQLVAEPKGLDDVIDTACAFWPKFKLTVNTGLGFLSWLPGWKARVAGVRAFMNALDKTFIPQLCGTDSATE